MWLGPLLTVALSAAPITIEPLGFSVRPEGDGVLVESVVPGGAAEKAGLKRGMWFQQAVQPRFGFATGPLGLLPTRDLRDALTPPHDEPLAFVATLAGQQRALTISRPDPPPKSPFRAVPLPMEEVARLSLRQQARYQLELATWTRARSRARAGQTSTGTAREAGPDTSNRVAAPAALASGPLGPREPGGSDGLTTGARPPPSVTKVKTPTESRQLVADVETSYRLGLQLKEHFPAACASPLEVASWLRSQPGVAWAEVDNEGRIRARVGQVPWAIHCHEREQEATQDDFRTSATPAAGTSGPSR